MTMELLTFYFVVEGGPSWAQDSDMKRNEGSFEQGHVW